MDCLSPYNDLGGNVSKIDSFEVRGSSKIGVQIVTTSANTEDALMNVIRGKLNKIQGAEQTRIYGTDMNGRPFELQANTIDKRGIGLLVQVEETVAPLVASESFMQRLAQVMRETGRAIRVVPLRGYK